MRYISPDEWNKMEKPDNVMIPADNKCIIRRCGELYCLCNTTNDSNFIVIFSKKFNIKNVKSIYKFILWLYTDYNINYITINCIPGRYKIMQELFYNWICIKNKNNLQEIIFRIDCNVKKLEQLSK